jgi:hypothetical protein
VKYVPIIYQDPTFRAAAITQALRQTAPKHLSPEATYRFYERLGIMCGAADPTPEQHRQALLEAREYDLNND